MIGEPCTDEIQRVWVRRSKGLYFFFRQMLAVSVKAKMNNWNSYTGAALHRNEEVQYSRSNVPETA